MVNVVLKRLIATHHFRIPVFRMMLMMLPMVKKLYIINNNGVWTMEQWNNILLITIGSILFRSSEMKAQNFWIF